MNRLKFCKFVVVTTLLGILGFQCYNAVQKLLNGEPSTTINEKYQTELDLPHLTLCRFTVGPSYESNEQMTLMDHYEKAKSMSLEDRFIKSVSFTNDYASEFSKFGRMLNFWNKSDVQITGYEWDKIWRHYFVYSNSRKSFMECFIFKAPFSVNPSYFMHLEFSLDLDNSRVLFKIHDADNFTTMYDRHLGSNIVEIHALKLRFRQVFEIEQSRIWHLSHDEQPCNVNIDTNFKSCVENMFTDRLNCTLPIFSTNPTNSANLRFCDKPEDLGALVNATEEIFSIKSLNELEEKSGCTRNCHYVRFDVNRFPDEPVPTNWTSVKFMVTQHSVTEQREKITYDKNSFIADVGGFLGLLLGLSILQAFEFVASFFAKLQQNMTT